MKDIVAEVRAILAAAKPANENKPELRLARQEKVDQLLAQLNSFKPRDMVYNADDEQLLREVG